MLLLASAALTSDNAPVSVTVLPLKVPPRLVWVATDSEPFATDSVTLKVSLSSLVPGSCEVTVLKPVNPTAVFSLVDCAAKDDRLGVSATPLTLIAALLLVAVLKVIPSSLLLALMLSVSEPSNSPVGV